MKKTYTKPELCVVRYSTSDMFCQCSKENLDTVKEWLGGGDIRQYFAAGDPCNVVAPIDGYCKFTATEGMQVFTS